MATVTVLDYGAGNIRSLINALKFLGCEVNFVHEPSDITKAQKLIFPGVGAFGSAMNSLVACGYAKPLKEYISQNRPFFGICLGMQTLCQGSDESPEIEGLGVLPATVKLMDSSLVAVPHMGWNGLNIRKETDLIPHNSDNRASGKVFFVHSYAILLDNMQIKDWVLATTNYGCEFISAVQRGNIIATQFHPEKSGRFGVEILKRFVNITPVKNDEVLVGVDLLPAKMPTQLAHRVIACMDVRSNDKGDLVVTKGEQYDVREQVMGESAIEEKPQRGAVRNLGKPVELAQRYFEEGADEVVFLNITSFRNCPLHDLPMVEVLRQASEKVFVPLTVGGGIRAIDAQVRDDEGNKVTKHFSALEVASAYFRSGADKVSIGSDAVYAAEEFITSKGVKTGKSSIETIASVYGAQAVVISVDPKRVYVDSPCSVQHHVIPTNQVGPNGEKYVWYQCTVKGGREARDIGVYELVRSCEALGAGEIMLNCIDKDGTNSGFDLELVSMVKSAVTIPVIASSGAGHVTHFSEVFEKAGADAALAAGIFHRNEVSIRDVKTHLAEQGFPVRPV